MYSEVVGRKTNKKYKIIMIVAAVAALVLVMLLSIILGTVDVSLKDIIELVRGNLEDLLIEQIIYNVRMPRIITGVFVGMNLAVAGVLLQGILRNPIASPNIIGVNAGAGLAAVIIMTLFPGEVTKIPIAAFLGAFLATIMIYALAMNATSNAPIVYIVLAGVAVSSILRAITSALMLMNSDVLDVTYTWLQGSLSGRSWTAASTIWPYSLIGLGIAIFISPKVNLFGLGDEMASSIGLPIKLYRIIIILTASVLAGSAVSVAGTIGFIGLIAPHTARLLIGGDNRYLVPLAAIIGATLLVLADTIARTVFQPVELPVGIITSVLGGPFFLILLYKKGRGQFHS